VVNVLIRSMLEKYSRKLRENGVQAEPRGEAEIIFPVAQTRFAYATVDELEKTAKLRHLQVRKYIEMYRGVEVQVLELAP